jgi:hypothetical protein
MRDASPWAFTNPIGYAGNVNSTNVLIFWTMLLFVFWLGTLTDKKVPAKVKDASEEGVGAAVPVTSH